MSWRDDESALAHVSSEHFKAAAAKMSAVLSAVPETIRTEVEAEGWSRTARIRLPAGPRAQTGQPALGEQLR